MTPPACDEFVEHAGALKCAIIFTASEKARDIFKPRPSSGEWPNSLEGSAGFQPAASGILPGAAQDELIAAKGMIEQMVAEKGEDAGAKETLWHSKAEAIADIRRAIMAENCGTDFGTAR